VENELRGIIDFRQIFDGIPGLIGVTTASGEVQLVNRQVLEYLGRTLDELKTWATTDVIHRDDLPEAIAAWKRSIDSGSPYDVEHRVRRADGIYRWFRVSGHPVRDTDGRIVHWCILQTDIDERKRAEALLAGEKRLLEMVASGSSMSGVLEALCQLVESTASGCYCSVVLVDPSGTRLEHGAAPSLPASFIASIIGRPVNVDSGPCAMAAYLNEQVIAADLTLETRWAAYEWCPMALAHGLQACWSTPISSTAGKVLGAFANYDEPRTPTTLQQSFIEQFSHIARIAVERAQNDAALKRSEGFLAEAQRLSSTGSFSWRVATDDITWSDQTYRIFEIDRATPVSFGLIKTRIHPEDLPAFEEQLERVRRDGCDVEFEFRLQMPGPSVKYIHVVAHSSRDECGRVECTGAIQDLTERRLSEDTLGTLRSELAHVARVTTLGALTASIAHEVNQPLSGIITNASTCLRMLADDPPNVEGARETARRAIRDGNRAADVIARLRALFGKKATATESMDLNEATREVLALSSSELQRERVIVRAELADDLPSITGDRVQLQQVILNLLLNAAEAMSCVEDRSRQLVIRTERDAGDCVRLTVQDTGEGFDPHPPERLFDAFYTTKRGGMGMGLSVSRSIIESHHGRLWAVPNDGPGARFAFSIPCVAGRVTAADIIGVIQASPLTDAQPGMRNS
jgi:PAS domain S-box-containing protein